MRRQTLLLALIVCLLSTLISMLLFNRSQREPDMPPNLSPTTVSNKPLLITQAFGYTNPSTVTKISPGEKVRFLAVGSLNSFSVYRMAFTLDFKGSHNDQPAQGQVKILIESTKKPHVMHLTIKSKNNMVQPAGDVNLYRVDNTTYMKNPADQSWMSFRTSTRDKIGAKEFFVPEDEIDLPQTAYRHPQPEMINGLATYRYTFDETDIAGSKFTLDKIQGQAWVAIDGDYLVKYEIAGRGTSLSPEMQNLFDRGTFTLKYELSDVNYDFTITLPPSLSHLVTKKSP